MDNEFYVVVDVHQKRKNIGTALRCAVAFGAKAVIVVGYADFGTHGAHGAQRHIEIICVPTWNECTAFARNLNCHIYGVVTLAMFPPDSDVCRNSLAVEQLAFQNRAFFVLVDSDDRRDELILQCDNTVHVGGINRKRLNFDSIVGICFHHFAVSCKFKEISFDSEKFCIVDGGVASSSTSEGVKYANFSSNIRKLSCSPTGCDNNSVDISDDVCIDSLFDDSVE